MFPDRNDLRANGRIVQPRQKWVVPRLVRMHAGDAENGLSVNHLDGQFSHS